MAKQKITYERARELVDYNPLTGEMRWRVKHGRAWPGDHVCVVRFDKKKGMYFRNGTSLDGVPITANRLAWLLGHGSLPEVGQIRTCNGDARCLQLSNLQVVHRPYNSLLTAD